MRQSFDPKEKSLPNVGLIELEDPETGELTTIDTSDREVRMRYEKKYAKEEESFTKELKKRGIDQFNFSTDRDFSHDLFKFFKLRQRRTR